MFAMRITYFYFLTYILQNRIEKIVVEISDLGGPRASKSVFYKMSVCMSAALERKLSTMPLYCICTRRIFDNQSLYGQKIGFSFYRQITKEALPT